MRTHIFTDIHGCLSELRQLFRIAEISRDDVVISAGDMVDRGPDSAGVVDFLYRRSLVSPTISIMGNHDIKHKRYRIALRKNPKLAQELAAKRRELAEVHGALSPQAAMWMDNSPLSYRDPEGRFAIVHGGITPRMKHLPTPDSPHKSDDLVMYVRYVNREGQMLRLGEETSSDSYWADVYDGRFGHIIFGHQAFIDATEPVRFAHATGLDLGCVFGGKLACISYDGNHSTFHTVNATREYARRKG